MRYLFLLSGEHLPLAAAEVRNLLRPRQWHCRKQMLFASSAPAALISRLAYTKAVYRVLFTATAATVLQKTGSFKWQRIYRNDFSVRALRLTPSSPLPDAMVLAAAVWKRLSSPRVNLAAAATRIVFISAPRRIYCCLLLHENEQRFHTRRAHLRPGFLPTSLHPKLARCIVNLTGIRSGTLLDPFCGTGGILLEAGLMGMHVHGIDIDGKALQRCQQNLEHYGIHNYTLQQFDSSLLRQKMRYVGADLPYGRSSRTSTVTRDLYRNFLSVLSQYLTGTAVIVFPTPRLQQFLPQTTKLKIEEVYSCYMHKSLTRYIAVVRRK